MATVLGILSGRASQKISDHFPFDERAIAADASAAELPAEAAVTRRHAFPIILTVPLAVTRTQRMMVARMKHRGEDTSRIRRTVSSARGVLAGLALIGASERQGN